MDIPRKAGPQVPMVGEVRANPAQYAPPRIPFLQEFVPPELRESLGRIPEAALAVSDFVGPAADVKDMKHYGGMVMDNLGKGNYSDALANTLMTGAALGMTALPGSVGGIDKTVKKLGVGDTVTHDKFGSGKILSTTENNLTVDFPGKGEALLNKNMVNEADLLSDVVTNPTANTFDTVESMVERLKEAGYEVIDENIRRSSNIAGRSAYLNVLKDRKRLPIRVSDHWSKWNEGLRVDAGDTPESILAKVDEHFAGPLPMDTASRMKRAEEMGFDTDAYHGTNQPDIPELQSGDIGIHVGDETAANVRLNDKAALSRGVNRYSTRGKDFGDNANILPLKVKSENPLRMDDAGEWRDPIELAKGLRTSAIGSKNPDIHKLLDDIQADADTINRSYSDLEDYLSDPEIMGMVDELREAVKGAGYDSIVYRNFTEATSQSGSDSLILLDPSQARSRFAKFDPAKKDSANLLAGVAGGGLAVNLGLAQRDNKTQ